MITSDDVTQHYLSPTKRGHMTIPWITVAEYKAIGEPSCFRFQKGPFMGRWYRMLSFDVSGIKITERTRDNS